MNRFCYQISQDMVVDNAIADGLRIGGAGAGVRDALGDRDATCRVRVLGVPTEYVPHGDPDDIHASFGLDAAGIAASVRGLL